MTLRRLVTVAFCVTLVPALLSACAVASSPTVSLSADQFWSGFGTVSAAEVDPAENLDELVSRSTLIVSGSIADLTEGPVDVYDLDEGEVSKPSTILTVDVSRVVAGTAEGEVRIWLSQENPSLPGVESLPPQEFLWFLRPSDTPGLYHTTTLAGVIGADSTGVLVTFRDRSAGESIIPPGTRELSELEDLVAEARA